MFNLKLHGKGCRLHAQTEKTIFFLFSISFVSFFTYSLVYSFIVLMVLRYASYVVVPFT